MVVARRLVAAVVVALLLAVTLGAAVPAPLPPTETDPAIALGLMLRRLPVMGTVLWITAHPDDESNGALVALRYGMGLRTVVLTATRGEGGQNEIGPELGDDLGLLRIGELEAVHRWDGAEQRFARAYDFGYSFSVDETYEKWGRAEILDDFVRAIRIVRPDVIVTLPHESKEGGQHHQAASRLAAEAFRAAADAKAYPPAAHGGVAPWQARKLYETGLPVARLGYEGAVRLPTDKADPLLGMTWFALGALARSRHRTQGMVVEPGSPTEYGYTLMDSEPPVDPAESGLLDGIDLSWRRLFAFAGEHERPALEASIPAIVAALEAAQAAFDVHAPEKTLPSLRTALTLVRRLREEALVADWEKAARLEIVTRLQAKETELVEAIALAHGMTFRIVANDAIVTPGQSLPLRADLPQAPAEVELKGVVLHLPDGWPASRADVVDERPFAVVVPADAAVSRPLGHRDPRRARYDIDESDRSAPVLPPSPVTASLRFTSGGLLISLDRPALFYGDGTTPPRPVAVLPAFSVEVAPVSLPIPHGRRSGSVAVTVRHLSPVPQRAVCRLRAPYGWRVQPAMVALRFTKADERQTVRFQVSPPRLPESHAPCAALEASATAAGRRYAEGFREIGYPHVATRFEPHAATVCAFALEAQVPPTARVGYVAGVGDGIPEALAQLGVVPTMLTDEDLARGDLGRFTTIVTGVRAYQTRRALKDHHERLLEYVRGGGHLVLQYNRPAEWNPDYAPYPAAVGRRRVTDETAPVQILRPDHPLLNVPNKLVAADFEGWVQDRAVYLFDAHDERYEELLSSADPFPLNAGVQKGLLVSTRVGNGRWTYVGLALWRQLQAGVPGAYRILANLVGRPRDARSRE